MQVDATIAREPRGRRQGAGGLDHVTYLPKLRVWNVTCPQQRHASQRFDAGATDQCGLLCGKLRAHFLAAPHIGQGCDGVVDGAIGDGCHCGLCRSLRGLCGKLCSVGVCCAQGCIACLCSGKCNLRGAVGGSKLGLCSGKCNLRGTVGGSKVCLRSSKCDLRGAVGGSKLGLCGSKRNLCGGPGLGSLRRRLRGLHIGHVDRQANLTRRNIIHQDARRVRQNNSINVLGRWVAEIVAHNISGSRHPIAAIPPVCNGRWVARRIERQHKIGAACRREVQKLIRGRGRNLQSAQHVCCDFIKAAFHALKLALQIVRSHPLGRLRIHGPRVIAIGHRSPIDSSGRIKHARALQRVRKFFVGLTDNGQAQAGSHAI